MRKSRKNYSNIQIETRKNLINDLNIDEYGTEKLIKLVFKINIWRNLKIEEIGRSFENIEFILIPDLS
jgi:hypothetical protein